MARLILLAFIWAGAGLQIIAATEEQDKESDVKYKGPVVYTNLPPPVLYFPNFPHRPKLSNRGSAGDLEDKRVDYVPFPYKDLPLLVYQSDHQPPVHVVEKTARQDTDKKNPGKSQSSSGYQTGPAVYRASESNDFGNQAAGSTQHSQATSLVTSPSEKYINVGLSDPQNPQFISIGVTSIQPQADQQDPNHGTESNDYYNTAQYPSNQNSEQGQHLQYVPQDTQQYANQDLRQSAPTFMYYSNQQYPPQNGVQQTQSHGQIPQALQNYLLQQNSEQQLSPSVTQPISTYSGKGSNIGPQSAPTQHVGITIIRQPAIPDSPDHGGDASQGHYHKYDAPQIQNPYSQGSNEQAYEDNQQFVSIGVFPSGAPNNDYEQDTQQYYNVIPPAQNNPYHNMNEDYRQIGQEQSASSDIMQNHNPQTTGYQLISIDLSALRNKMTNQERGPYPEPNQQVYQSIPPQRPIINIPPQNYGVQNQKDNAYGGGEKQVQQIVIQIPQTIIADQANKPPRERGANESPYTGTAQVANIISESNKIPNRPSASGGPIYNRPSQFMQHPERPRNPNEGFGFPPNGINIAIIKQTESSNNSPTYKTPAETMNKRPRAPPPGKFPNRPNQMHKVRPPPPPPHFSRPPQHHRPSFNSKPRFPPNRQRYNRGHEMSATASAPYPATAPRYPPQHFGQYRSKSVVHQLGGHPGIYASSNLHFSATHPPTMNPPFFGNAYAAPPSVPFPHTSATRNHPHFIPGPGASSMPFNPFSAESTLHAFTNNISNSFGDVNFDEINAFLDPNYDLFGSMADEQNKKNVEEENKFMQTVTGDLLIQDFAVPGMFGAFPPHYGLVKPPPSVLNPFPYNNWGLAPGNFAAQGAMPGRDRLKLFSRLRNPQYSQMGDNQPFGIGKKRGLRKRPRRLKSKLQELRSNMRQKKIAPRQETIGEETGGSKIEKIISEIMTDYDKASPRSTIIQTDGPGLDGISIPLNTDQVLSSRISTEDNENEKGESLPPIIVYKGTKPPIEIYGDKADIEHVGQHNKTETEYSVKPESTEKSEQSTDELNSHDILISSGQKVGYLDYMYSILPDLIRDTLGRRHDEDTDTDGSHWLPVRSIEYAVAEDSYDRNETSTDQSASAFEVQPLKDGGASQNSSSKSEPSIKENVDELFSLQGKEEKSDLVKE